MPTGLTSLREPPLRTTQPSFDLISPKEKEQIQLQEIRVEITSLIKMRDNLRYEIKNLRLDIDKAKERSKSDTEVKRLKIQKLQLLSEIRKITDILMSMKDSRKGIIKGFNDFGQERITNLKTIEQELNKEIESEDARIFLEYQQVEGSMELLSGMIDYYQQYFKITEQTASQNDLKSLQLTKDREIAVKEKERLKNALQEAENKVKDVRRFYKESKTEYDAVKSVSLKFNKQKEKIEKEQREKEHLLKTDKNIVEAEKKGLVLERERLSKWKKQLEDKEKTLQRVYKEIQAKSKMV